MLFFNTMSNQIKTILQFNESKIKEKGSLFIGLAYPILTVESTDSVLLELRKKYYDSTHICYAYKINPQLTKYSDDGEPTGTAGIRLLNAIQHFDLTNILLVSIRYFGGVKLGVGPLGKTYYLSGLETLKSAKIVEQIEYAELQVIFDYSLLKTIHHTISKFECKIVDTISSNNQTIILLIKSNLINDFSNTINQLTNSKAIVKETNVRLFI